MKDGNKNHADKVKLQSSLKKEDERQYDRLEREACLRLDDFYDIQAQDRGFREEFKGNLEVLLQRKIEKYKRTAPKKKDSNTSKVDVIAAARKHQEERLKKIPNPLSRPSQGKREDTQLSQATRPAVGFRGVQDASTIDISKIDTHVPNKSALQIAK